MHFLNEQQFVNAVAQFLGPYYITLAMMNAVAAFYLWQARKETTNALVLLFVSLFYVILAPLAASGDPAWMSFVSVPESLRLLINENTGPVIYSVGTTSILVVLFIFRRFFVQPAVAWTLWNLSLLALGLSMTDEDFFAIVAKPDNVPIVALVFMLGFFTWLATSKAVKNDDRAAAGQPPLEKLDCEKVLVWPDLVYIELICMIAVTALLIFWAIALKAPLEDMGNIANTPNPSKAPWYFLGLQEMLVYFDPWMAGVVLPSLIVVGLMAIPYLDFNKSGSGYYSIANRKFSYLIFQFGFLEMWITLIVLGTFLRGPNWSFFGPYEYWDLHKVAALNNVDLSQYFWVMGLGTGLPRADSDSGRLIELGYIIWREAPGIILVLGYFVLLPPLMAVTVFKKFFVRMGFIRYMVMVNLLLFMASLPIKMVLRWTCNMKYLIAIPEYFLNF